MATSIYYQSVTLATSKISVIIIVRIQRLQLHHDIVMPSVSKYTSNKNVLPGWSTFYFLLPLTQAQCFAATFYFFEKQKFLHFYFLKSRILGKQFYFVENNKVFDF